MYGPSSVNTLSFEYEFIIYFIIMNNICILSYLSIIYMVIYYNILCEDGLKRDNICSSRLRHAPYIRIRPNEPGARLSQDLSLYGKRLYYIIQ